MRKAENRRVFISTSVLYYGPGTRRDTPGNAGVLRRLGDGDRCRRLKDPGRVVVIRDSRDAAVRDVEANEPLRRPYAAFLLKQNDLRLPVHLAHRQSPRERELLVPAEVG